MKVAARTERMVNRLDVTLPPQTSPGVTPLAPHGAGGRLRKSIYGWAHNPDGQPFLIFWLQPYHLGKKTATVGGAWVQVVSTS